MLKTRILTAIVLLAVLLPVLYSRSLPAFGVVAALFLGAAIWEAMRLFARKHGVVAALLWVGGFVFSLYWQAEGVILYAVVVALWLLRWVPMLGLGLPPLANRRNRLLSMMYMISIFACFFAMAELFERSPVYLLSVLVLVWLADSGAYFVGRAIGKRKLAPTISPGKSWEGAIGGALTVLLAGVASVEWGHKALQDTFVVQMHAHWGYGGMLPLLLLVVAASVVGDLVESQLKRRAQIKDSSQLLPGHGGVLDRIDALIPVLPLAALISHWLGEAGASVLVLP
jgi:phosphatidate cytidylyltransferase